MSKQQANRDPLRYAKLASITLLLLLIVWLGFDFFRSGASSCDAIFQQTENQFALKLNYLDTEGSVVLGRQQIQSLTEKAQLTAINLKACCVMQKSGSIEKNNFNLCKSGSDVFENKLTLLQDQLKQYSQARDAGDEQQQQTAKVQIGKLVREATESANVMERRVEKLPRASLRKKTGGYYFYEDFDRERLDPGWQIKQPDNHRWALQSAESSLLVVTQKGSVWGKNQDLRNQFLLNYTMPEGDFVLETRVSIPIQHQENGASIALWQDADNFLQIGYRGFPHGYNVRRSPFFLKEIAGRNNTTESGIGRTGGVKTAETVYLRMAKQGNKYTGYYALPENGVEYDALKWQIIATHAIPGFISRPALWADNNDGEVYTTGNSVSPEVPVEFHYLSVK
jgi:hypothetical protein